MQTPTCPGCNRLITEGDHGRCMDAIVKITRPSVHITNAVMQIHTPRTEKAKGGPRGKRIPPVRKTRNEIS